MRYIYICERIVSDRDIEHTSILVSTTETQNTSRTLPPLGRGTAANGEVVEATSADKVAHTNKALHTHILSSFRMERKWNGRSRCNRRESQAGKKSETKKQIVTYLTICRIVCHHQECELRISDPHSRDTYSNIKAQLVTRIPHNCTMRLCCPRVKCQLSGAVRAKRPRR